MLLIGAIIFLPVVIVLVTSRILGDMLLKDGKRDRIMMFIALNVLAYAGIIYLVAQVDGQ